MNVFAVTGLIGTVLWLVELGLVGFGFVDALRRKPDAFPAADKQPRNLWLVLMGIGLGWMLLWLLLAGSTNPLGLLNLVGVVAAAVYLADVRPAVREVDGRGRSGPYGPW